ncbi:MAG: Chromosome partition protein Smc [Planctomycetes bacterium ADurb.Bin401]|nr:MAG: Chromosome partition protein Smc [Planctomycetes bacterium ADurb.Bin401]
MGTVLNALVKLQSVENSLRAAKAKLARSRRNVILKENQLRTLQNSLAAKQEEIQLTKIQADRLELELKSVDETLAKYRAALNAAKSNKEYSAILTELNTTKADSSKVETQTLELMKNIEADQTQCELIKQQIEAAKDELNEIRRQSEEQAKKFENEIAEIEVQWHQAAKDLPGEILDTFKRVAETYDGEALAEVEVQDHRSGVYTCGGCFMSLTTETANTLMSKDEIIRCPNCTRILFLKDSES